MCIVAVSIPQPELGVGCRTQKVTNNEPPKAFDVGILIEAAPINVNRFDVVTC
jgi:hypothetical protein